MFISFLRVLELCTLDEIENMIINCIKIMQDMYKKCICIKKLFLLKSLFRINVTIRNYKKIFICAFQTTLPNSSSLGKY